MSDTLPKEVQVAPPSVENCQVPWAVSAPVTTTPRAAPASGSLMLRPAAKAATAVPALPVSSSLTAGNVAVTLPRTGASFTGLMVTYPWAVALAGGAPLSCTV